MTPDGNKHKNGKQFFILLTHLQDMNKSIQIQSSPATHEIFNHLFRLTILLHTLIIYLYLGKGANDRKGIGREITVSIHISLLSFVYSALVSPHGSLDEINRTNVYILPYNPYPVNPPPSLYNCSISFHENTCP